MTRHRENGSAAPRPPLLDRERLTRIGTVVEPHGVEGAVKVRPATETPDFYEGRERVYVDAEIGLQQARITDLQRAGNHWILRLEGVGSRRAAEALAGAELLLPEEELRPLAEDEYFHHDLIGCAVETLDGTPVGEVASVMDQAAQDLLVVRDGRREVLVPLVADIVREVDVAGRRIRIAPPPGLLELNE